MTLISSLMSLLFFGAIAAILFVTLLQVRTLKDRHESIDEFDTAETVLWITFILSLVVAGVQGFTSFGRQRNKLFSFGVIGGSAAIAGLCIWIAITFGSIDTDDELLEEMVRYMMAVTYVVATFAGVACGVIIAQSFQSDPAAQK